MNKPKVRVTGVPEIDLILADVAAMLGANLLWLARHHPRLVKAMVRDRPRLVARFQKAFTASLSHYYEQTMGSHYSRRRIRPLGVRHGEKNKTI